MFVCDFDEYHIQLDVANTCNIMSYAFMLITHDNGITSLTYIFRKKIKRNGNVISVFQDGDLELAFTDPNV